MTTALETAPGAGSLTLVIGERAVTLKCCAEAAVRLSRQPGGIIDFDNPMADTVHRRVRRMHIDTMCEVIRAGAGVGSNAGKDLERQLYDFGLLDLSRELSGWIIKLTNGGKSPFTPTVAEDEDGERPLGETIEAKPQEDL